MKKHIIVFSLLIYVALSSILVSSMSIKLQESSTVNSESEKIFALISKSCYLQKTPTKILDYTNTYCILEESYFVIVESSMDDYYYVKYQDLTGYCDKENLMLVNEKIENPFLDNITFDVYKDTFLYNEPKASESNIIIPIKNCENVKFIGKIYSEEISSTSSNIWYYCKINLGGKEIKGYIHSSFTNNLTPITQNNSNYTLLSQNTNTLLNLSQSTQIIITIVVSVPILFILYLFLKGFKKV